MGGVWGLGSHFLVGAGGGTGAGHKGRAAGVGGCAQFSQEWCEHAAECGRLRGPSVRGGWSGEQAPPPPHPA